MDKAHILESGGSSVLRIEVEELDSLGTAVADMNFRIY